MRRTTRRTPTLARSARVSRFASVVACDRARQLVPSYRNVVSGGKRRPGGLDESVAESMVKGEDKTSVRIAVAIVTLLVALLPTCAPAQCLHRPEVDETEAPAPTPAPSAMGKNTEATPATVPAEPPLGFAGRR